MRAGQGEGEEDDVAGHVGHEHVTEHEVAAGVDQSGHDGQGEEHRWQRAIGGSTRGHDRLAEFGQERLHRATPVVEPRDFLRRCRDAMGLPGVGKAEARRAGPGTIDSTNSYAPRGLLGAPPAGESWPEGGCVAAVSVAHLSKRYGDLDAVNDVVVRGTAGGGLRPARAERGRKDDDHRDPRGVPPTGTRVEVEVLGFDPADKSTSRELREHLGVVLQELAVEPFLSVRQALTRNAGYYPSPRPVAEVLDLVGLESKADASHQDPVGWPAAASRPRARDHRESRAPRPGRAHHRVRPLGASRGLGSRAGHDRRGHDRHPHHALHGRGRGLGRSCGGHQRRPDRGRGRARGARWP